MLAQFEEVGVRKKKLEDGVQIDVAVTKYWVKFDGIDAAEYTERLNITRMFEKLLASKKCPAEIKRELAAELNNKAAKAYLGKVRASEPSTEVVKEEAELQAKRRASQIDGKARAREDERQEQITKFIVLDTEEDGGHQAVSGGHQQALGMWCECECECEPERCRVHV